MSNMNISKVMYSNTWIKRAFHFSVVLYFCDYFSRLFHLSLLILMYNNLCIFQQFIKLQMELFSHNDLLNYMSDCSNSFLSVSNFSL